VLHWSAPLAGHSRGRAAAIAYCTLLHLYFAALLLHGHSRPQLWRDIE